MQIIEGTLRPLADAGMQVIRAQFVPADPFPLPLMRFFDTYPEKAQEDAPPPITLIIRAGTARDSASV